MSFHHVETFNSGFEITQNACDGVHNILKVERMDRAFNKSGQNQTVTSLFTKVLLHGREKKNFTSEIALR